MIPNMKFYVISIVSIFLALAIGIYIGFTLDAQNFLVEQKEDIASKLEEKFDYLRSENENFKKEIEKMEVKNSQYEKFNETVYPEIIKNRLSGTKVAIIETNDEYIYSGIGKTLEMSGATVVNVTTIKDKFLNEDTLKEAYLKSGIDKDELKENVIGKAISDLSTAIISDGNEEVIKYFEEYGLLNIIGNIDESVDYVIIAGGSDSKDIERINILDKTIIDSVKKMELPIIGIEKTTVKNSYMKEYKDYRISTVDNVDSIIGKVALIMSMEGRPGNYGVKSSAESLLPDPSYAISE